MKYIKTFEHTIKHTDEIAVNHILRDWSRKFEDIIIELDKLDRLNDKSKNKKDFAKFINVKRYFNDDKRISIMYKVHDEKTLRFTFYVDENEYVNLFITAYLSDWGSGKKYSHFKDFFNFISEKNSKYTKQEYTINKMHSMVYNFPISEKDDFLFNITFDRD